MCRETINIKIYRDKAFPLWQLHTKYMLTNVLSNKSLPWVVRARQRRTLNSDRVFALLGPNVKGGPFLAALLRWLSERDQREDKIVNTTISFWGPGWIMTHFQFYLTITFQTLPTIILQSPFSSALRSLCPCFECHLN